MDYQIDSELARDFQEALSADESRECLHIVRRMITVETAEKLGPHWTNDFIASSKIRRSRRREAAKRNKFLWKFYDRASWKT